MKLDKNTNILIVGLGVIGGGYAAELSRQGYTVRCITKEQREIDYALEHGMIAEGSTEPKAELLANAQLVVCALYPSVFLEWIRENHGKLSSGCIVTDVTGVKGAVVREVQSCLGEEVEFISAHPMAGRERSGVEFADPCVFRGANYIITPTERNSEEAISICRRLGEILGFGRISVLTVEEHDRMIAFLSQLTHVIAVTLMNCSSTPGLEKYTGDSFRDLTRIAKINDRMWSELFLLNKQALLDEMNAFIREFETFRTLLAEEDSEGMRERMRASTARRSLFDKPTA